MPKVKFTQSYRVRYNHSTYSFAAGDEVGGLLARHLVSVGAPVETEDTVVRESEPSPDVVFSDIPFHAELAEAGFDTVEAVRNATNTALRNIEGLGPATLRSIRELVGS